MSDKRLDVANNLALRADLAADTQTRRHADTQTRRHADTQTRRHADTQLWVVYSLCQSPNSINSHFFISFLSSYLFLRRRPKCPSGNIKSPYADISTFFLFSQYSAPRCYRKKEALISALKYINGYAVRA
jgi:hypothetical protein